MNLRKSASVKEVIARAAGSRGTTVSNFTALSAYNTARQIANQQVSLTVSVSDFAAFARMLERPAKANATLRRLMRQDAVD